MYGILSFLPTILRLSNFSLNFLAILTRMLDESTFTTQRDSLFCYFSCWRIATRDFESSVGFSSSSKMDVNTHDNINL
jgi:hypothetical protein